MRSFIAINLPDSVKRDIDLIAAKLHPAGPPARWVPGENLHLTLKFLDEITDAQVMPIRGAITLAASGLQAFEIRLSGFGVFPNERKARVFWIGIEQGYETLKNLTREIDRAIVPLGFAPEAREFSAHITLARFREPGPVDHLMKASSRMPYQSEGIRVEGVELMKSVLSRDGAAYSILESVRLSASGA